jgi:hypothetical protein
MTPLRGAALATLILIALSLPLEAAPVEVRLVEGTAHGLMACVILTEDVPAFVRCDGSLYLKGPVWRMEMTTAR